MLWQRALAVTTSNPLAHEYYGEVLGTDGELDEAIAQYRQALQLEPNLVEAHLNLGFALEH